MRIHTNTPLLTHVCCHIFNFFFQTGHYGAVSALPAPAAEGASQSAAQSHIEVLQQEYEAGMPNKQIVDDRMARSLDHRRSLVLANCSSDDLLASYPVLRSASQVRVFSALFSDLQFLL